MGAMSDVDLFYAGSYCLALLVLTACALSIWHRHQVRQWRTNHLEPLLKTRPASTRDSYMQHFRDLGISEHVITGSWTALQWKMGKEEFPILPDDNLDDVYEVPLDELIDDALFACGCENIQMVYPDVPNDVLTVEDLVRFCNQRCVPRGPHQKSRLTRALNRAFRVEQPGRDESDAR